MQHSRIRCGMNLGLTLKKGLNPNLINPLQEEIV